MRILRHLGRNYNNTILDQFKIPHQDVPTVPILGQGRGSSRHDVWAGTYVVPTYTYYSIYVAIQVVEYDCLGSLRPQQDNPTKDHEQDHLHNHEVACTFHTVLHTFLHQRRHLRFKLPVHGKPISRASLKKASLNHVSSYPDSKVYEASYIPLLSSQFFI
jgi:hypothetical protein